VVAVGAHEDVKVSVGDVVVLRKYSGTEVKLDGEDHRIADAWPGSYTRSNRACCSTRAGCESRLLGSPTSTIPSWGQSKKKRVPP
jgi:hypothetical protein